MPSGPDNFSMHYVLYRSINILKAMALANVESGYIFVLLILVSHLLVETNS